MAFIDEFITVNEKGDRFQLLPHQRTVLELAFDFDDELKLPWDTIIYSCPKKSGKTSINAAVTLAWAYTQESPNELYILANDEEQAKSRTYSTAVRMIRKARDPRIPAAIVGGDRGLGVGALELSTGTIVRAIPAVAAGAAGSNHGFTSWDELWGYTSEASRRLWDEMTPVPTRRNSVRFITTYAGFENESKLLWDLYLSGVGKDEHPEGRGERLHPELPIYGNREAGIFCYWDREPRMPWQTPIYYAKQRRQLSAAAYLRLHGNQWVASVTRFIPPEVWDPCVGADRRPLLRAPALSVVVGVDAATKKDSAAVVAVAFDETARAVRLVAHAVWRPAPEEPIDLEATVEDYLRGLAVRFALEAVVYDPYQFVVIAKHLAEAGLPMEEFPQTSDRLTAMGQNLWDLLVGRNLELYPDPVFREHALNAVSVETPRGWKIAKEKARHKIDLLVALAMAALRCVKGQELGGPQVHIVEIEAEKATEAVGPEETPADKAKRDEAEREVAARQARDLWQREGAWRAAG